ncbi:MAG TPA: nuclear transport factor 2 family protein, partial [Thermoanaerobaculia bacterium]|nr:nuclear transport factor 2 family protein [Thermoanaerobaculia bacterium]
MANVQASTEAVEALFTQVFRDGNYDLADKILTDDFRFQYPFPGFAPGPEGIKQFSREFNQGFPGFEVEVN